MFTNSLNPWMYLNLEEPDRFSFRFLFPQFARFADDDEPAGGGGGGDGKDDDPPAGGDDDKDWKAEYATEVVQSKKYRGRAQTAEKLVAELQEASGRTLSPEDFEAYQQQLNDAESQEQTDLLKKGEFDAALTKAEEKFEGQRTQYRAESDAKVAKADAERDAAIALAVKFAGQAPLALALAEAGVLDEMIGIAERELARQIQVTFGDDNKPVINVVDSAGEVITDPDGAAGQSITVKELVTQWLATPAGAGFIPPSGDSGSGARKGGGKAGITIEDLDADNDKKAAFIEEHGIAAYLKLAASKGRTKD